MLNKLKYLFTIKKRLLSIVLFFFSGIIALSVLYQFDWSGFGKDFNRSITIEEVLNKEGKIVKLRKETEHFQSAKTLWDWLGLAGTIAIPVVIYQFQASEQRRAEEKAKAEKEAGSFVHSVLNPLINKLETLAGQLSQPFLLVFLPSVVKFIL